VSDIAHVPYEPSCLECRRAAGKADAGTTWQCVGHVYLERDRLRAALATAQAETAHERLRYDGMRSDRDDWRKRCEAAQAERERRVDAAIHATVCHERARLRLSLTEALLVLRSIDEIVAVCEAARLPRGGQETGPAKYNMTIGTARELRQALAPIAAVLAQEESS